MKTDPPSSRAGRWLSGAVLLTVFLLGGIGGLRAQNYTFLPTTGSNEWRVTSNWDTGTVPDGADATVILGTPSGGPIISLANTLPKTIGHLVANGANGTSWLLSYGSLYWETTSGAPTVTLHNSATYQSLNISANLLDPTGGPESALELYTDITEGVIAFGGNNTGYTAGFHMKSSVASSVSLLYGHSMSTNTLTLSGANHRVRFGLGGSNATQTYSGNITMGAGANQITLFSSGDAGQLSIIEGVISGAGEVRYARYRFGDLKVQGNNTYTGNSVITSINLTFTDVSNFGTGSKISFTNAIGTEATLIYAAGNTDDLTKKGDGSARVVDIANSNATINTNGNDVSFANAVSVTGSANFTKAGAGTLRLESGTNNFGVALRVSGGTLLVNNASGNGTGASQVLVGSVLGGTGSVRPGSANSIVIQTGGALSAGDSLVNSGVGNFTINLSSTTGNLTFQNNSLLSVDLNTGLAADKIVLSSNRTSSVIFAGDTKINLTDQSGGNLDEGAYLLFSATDSGVYSGLTLSGNLITSGLSVNSGVPSGWTSSLRLDSGNIYLDLVPEPTALVLLGLSAGLLAFRRRRVQRP